MKVFLTIAVIVGIIVAVFYYGPVTATRQWEKMQPKAESDVTDVVQRGLESYLSHHGVDLMNSHASPQVRQVDFLVSPIQFSFPKSVGFHGTTTGGNFQGIYYTDSGEVEATCEVGGITFAGLSTAYKSGNKTFDVTGRNRDGQLTVEVDGKNGDVIYPQKDKK